MADFVPQRAIEHALLDADATDGILAEDTTFDHPSFDIAYECADEDYMQKVYTIITKEWYDHPLQERAKSIFEMRRRNKFDKADTVYDAWLLRSGHERDFLPKSKFFKHFPELRFTCDDLACSSSDEDTNAYSSNNPASDDSSSDIERRMSRKKRKSIKESDSDEETEDNKKYIRFTAVKQNSPTLIVLSSDEETEIAIKKEDVKIDGEKEIIYIDLLSDSD